MPYSDYTQKWINKKASSKHFAHQYLEKPAMVSLLPDLKNKKVLCIGCGSGEECEVLLKLGAAKVVGIDNNHSFIEHAKKTYPVIEFHTIDAQNITSDLGKFDFVYSSLALHYLENWESFFENLKLILKPEAEFLFSTHHPLKWGSKSIKTKELNQFVMGYKKLKTEKTNSNFEIYGDYLNFRVIKEKLFGEMEITHYHRSISQMFQEITTSGFQIVSLLEPKPTLESKAVKQDFYEVHSKIPLFVIFKIKQCF